MRIMFVGDISLGEHYFSFGHGPRTQVENNVDIFKNVAPILRLADFVVGNLEGPLSDYNFVPTNPCSRVFRGSPLSADHLVNANLNIVTVANNHFMQHGEVSAKETVKCLENKNIDVIGLSNRPPLIKIIDNLIVGFLAYSDIPDNTDSEQRFYEKLDVEKAKKDIASLAKNVDFVIAIMHWGIEGPIGPTFRQMEIAQSLFDSGAHVIVGHHPHVLQRIDLSDNKLLAYSLGNFVFDLPWDWRLNKSAILDIELSKGENGLAISSANLWQIVIDRNGIPSLVDSGSQSIDLWREGFVPPSKPQSIPSLHKLFYFLSNICKGDTLTKMRFLIWKIKCKLKIVV